MSETMKESSIDVGNTDNSVKRWEEALNYYRESCSNIRNTRSSERIRCVAIMDTSYSMDGKRLICVKLGLCSLLANFEAEDEMNLIAFASKVVSVTEGFKSVSELVTTAPQLLHAMLTDGCTACYDAIVEGVGAMRDRSSLYQSFATSKSDAVFKNVAIVLTDGEDNESVHTAKSVERLLCNPRMSHFMFLMVAVDMSKQWERKFKRWMDLSHCKQVRVNVRTGSSLVGVFKEMLLCRILQTESTSVRFLQDGMAVEGVGSGTDGLSEEEYLTLRSRLMRHVGATTDIVRPGVARGRGVAWTEGDEDDEDDEDDEEENEDEGMGIPSLNRNTSEGVSSVCSCSDGGDFNDWHGGGDDMSDDDDDVSDDDSLPPKIKLRNRSYDSSDSDSSDSDSSIDLSRALHDNFVVKDGDNDSRCCDNNLNDSINDNIAAAGMTYPSECYCPISHSIMTDPVICADGHTYEKKNIQNWLITHSTSPNTNAVLDHKQLIQNHSLRNLIQLLTNQIKSVASNEVSNFPSISEI